MNNTEESRKVKRLGEDIVTAAERYLNANGYQGFMNDFKWEFNLVKDDQANAFAMPGGKVVVYTGILDEAQNCSSEQMKMFLTRIGLNSKAVVTGDITQTDLPSGQKSGLVEAKEILSHMKEISFCNFNEKDSVRHRIVKLVIQAYSKAQK